MKRSTKRISVILLTLAMVLSLAACGNSNSGSSNNNNSTNDSSSTVNGAAGNDTQLNYPDGNVGVVVQFSAGGPTDMSVRGVLDAAKGVTFAVENVTGGSGLIGLTKVATSPADGYTLGCINVDLAINYALGRTEISPKDFIPLACSICDYYTLIVGKDAPYNTMEEFVEYVKAHPGEVTVGDTGAGAAPNLCAIAVADSLDLDYKTVTYEGGSADCITAIVGGHLDATFTQLSPAKGQLEAGELKAIACVSKERMKSWPDIPTIKESYPDTDLEIAGWVFISAYQGTDEAICDYLEGVLGTAASSEEFAATLEGLSMQNVPMTRAEAETFVADQMELYATLCEGLDIE